MKVYLIWNEYEGTYWATHTPTKDPHWCPNCYESWESALKDLKKGIGGIYEVIDEIKRKTKRTYIFGKRKDIDDCYFWKSDRVKYVIIERTLK